MDLTSVRFGLGDHTATPAPTGNRDLCIMEAVAYIAGEPWSSSPACASPVVSAFLRVWNDALSDDDRDRLLPADVWGPRLVGSRVAAGFHLPVDHLRPTVEKLQQSALDLLDQMLLCGTESSPPPTTPASATPWHFCQ